jgi:acyl-CoA hydrolase
MEPRPVSHSAFTMAQLILPQQAGRAGFAHGGEIMKMMDTAAGVVAVRHCHKDSVTARVDGINFYHPIRVYNLVSVDGCLTFVGRSSMEVRVEVWAEDIAKEEKVHALTAYFIMVAVDQDGKPSEVPPLELSSRREKELWEKGKQRYQVCKGELMSGEASYKVCREESVT